MKHFSIMVCALVGACLFVSCKSEKSEEIVSESINYTFNGFAVESGLIDELFTRAEANYNLLVVDVKDGSFVQCVSRVQVPMSEALSDVTLPLSVGSHQIYFLCSSHPWHNFDQSSLLVSWDEQTSPLSDTWSAALDVTVQQGAPQTRSVSLNRVVAYVRTLIEDKLPANLSQFRQILVGGSWSFDLTRQCGDMPSQIIRNTDISSGYIGRDKIGISIYTFVPEGVTTATSYTSTALDADGASIQSMTFTSVPIEVNRYTTYQGSYFSPNNSFELSLETAWGDAVVIPF